MSNEYHVHEYCGKNFDDYARQLTGLSIYNAIIIVQKCLNERTARNNYYLESHRGSEKHAGHEHAKAMVNKLLQDLRAARAAPDYNKENSIHVTHEGGWFILEILYKNSNSGQYLTRAKCKNVKSCSVQGGKKSRKSRKSRKTRKSRK